MTEQAPRAVTPSTVAAYLVAAFCALMLVKWMALAALVALALFAALRWLVVRLLRARRGPQAIEVEDGGAAPAGAADCSWCGRTGGHLDPLGRPLRPRHAHGMSRAA